MNAPDPRWKLDCPWCTFYIDVANRSRAGEIVADMMQDHVASRHLMTWKDFLQATKGSM